jgi:tetratricopeptide (TPR) repeat protein
MIDQISIISLMAAGSLCALLLLGGCSKQNTTADYVPPSQPVKVTASSENSKVEEKPAILSKAEVDKLNIEIIEAIKKGDYQKGLDMYRDLQKNALIDKTDPIEGEPDLLTLQAIEKAAVNDSALKWVKAQYGSKLGGLSLPVVDQLAIVAIECDDLDFAITTIQENLAKNPDDPASNYTLILASLLVTENNKLQGEPKKNIMGEAEQALKRMAKEGSENPKYHIASAYINVVNEKFEESLKEFEKSLNPRYSKDIDTVDEIDSNYYMGLLLLRENRTNESKKCFDKAESLYAKLDPDSKERYNGIRHSMILCNDLYFGNKITEKSFEPLLKEFDTLSKSGTQHLPRLKTIHEAIYGFYSEREKGNKKACLNHLKKLTILLKISAPCQPFHKLISPRSLAIFHTYRGDIFAELGQKKQAEYEYHKALEYIPGDQLTKQRLKNIS